MNNTCLKDYKDLLAHTPKRRWPVVLGNRWADGLVLSWETFLHPCPFFFLASGLFQFRQMCFSLWKQEWPAAGSIHIPAAHCSRVKERKSYPTSEFVKMDLFAPFKGLSTHQSGATHRSVSLTRKRGSVWPPSGSCDWNRGCLCQRGGAWKQNRAEEPRDLPTMLLF